MNPFVARKVLRSDQWILPVSLMSLVVGFMFVMAWTTATNRKSRYELLEPNQQQRVSESTIDIDEVAQLRSKVNALVAENTTLQNTLAKGTDSAKLLNQDLQAAKLFAGLTPVEGPGVIVTVRDSSRGPLKDGDQVVFTPDSNVHDLDVLRIVNELFASGAEAVAVNDHRITGGSSFRCVGPTILINDVKVASPIVIKAVGDPKTLVGGLNLNGGVLSEIRTSDPNMVQMEEEKSMRLDAFAGKSTYTIAKAPKGN